MQYLLLFAICFVLIGFFMFILTKSKKKSSCACGQGHCQTGQVCDNKESDGIKH
ncbi:MAG: FeoB-associated Cys-rich membrane protein [Deferribacterales bacterium]